MAKTPEDEEREMRARLDTLKGGSTAGPPRRASAPPRRLISPAAALAAPA